MAPAALALLALVPAAPSSHCGEGTGFQLRSSLPCSGQAVSARNREAGIGRVDVTDHGFRYGRLSLKAWLEWLLPLACCDPTRTFCSVQKQRAAGPRVRRMYAPLPRLAMWKNCSWLVTGRGLIFILRFCRFGSLPTEVCDLFRDSMAGAESLGPICTRIGAEFTARGRERARESEREYVRITAWRGCWCCCFCAAFISGFDGQRLDFTALPTARTHTAYGRGGVATDCRQMMDARSVRCISSSLPASDSDPRKVQQKTLALPRWAVPLCTGNLDCSRAAAAAAAAADSHGRPACRPEVAPPPSLSLPLCLSLSLSLSQHPFTRTHTPYTPSALSSDLPPPSFVRFPSHSAAASSTSAPPALDSDDKSHRSSHRQRIARHPAHLHRLSSLSALPSTLARPVCSR